jgi:hypothetical protein
MAIPAISEHDCGQPPSCSIREPHKCCTLFSGPGSTIRYCAALIDPFKRCWRKRLLLSPTDGIDLVHSSCASHVFRVFTFRLTVSAAFEQSE